MNEHWILLSRSSLYRNGNLYEAHQRWVIYGWMVEKGLNQKWAFMVAKLFPRLLLPKVIFKKNES